jgi:hypothetical protein
LLIRHDEIFRREAVDFQRRRLSGNVVLRPDRPSTILCVAYGLVVCGLTAAFSFVSFPVATHAGVRCVEPGSRFLEALHPRFPAGTVLQRAEVDAADGTPIAVWSSGRYSVAGTTAARTGGARRRNGTPSGRCAVTYSLISRPADAVLRRLFHGS